MAFRYDPLVPEAGYIRLLTLQPSPDPLANIECTIAHDAVGQAKYAALSYTWGSVEEKQSITLNRYSFAVTKNLFTALQHLRSVNEPITLWIDAICINQEDVDERTHQVKQMVQIYKNATQVLIWMGEEIEHLDAAISLMNCEFRRDGWDALVKLLERPWWSRVWIIQEVVYGKDPVV
ncbi:heterokaryon incompatibility protein-domain-containing protein, partial [Bisporella sp. PMI_857]